MGENAPAIRQNRDPSVSLTERAIQAVRASIRNGKMVSGELYSVNQVALELGVSRSPVRDALLRLEETGVIKFERYRGFRLLLHSPRDLAQIFAVRLALEIPAARSAATRATAEQLVAIRIEREALERAAIADDEPDFMLHDQRLHRAILDCAGNAYASRIIDSIRDTTRLGGASTVKHSRGLIEIFEEHLPIIEAIEHQDADAAGQAMSAHLTRTGTLLLQKALEAHGVDAEAQSRQLWQEIVEGYAG